jgi:cell division protein FtsW
MSGLTMLVAGGGRFRDFFILVLICAVTLAGVIYTRPYVMKRITTFLNPTADPLGAGYQIQQSLIAIGSGQITGRGFGQSIQKFNYLPEPIGDSIFAVGAEEFGFFGSVALIMLFIIFAFRALKIAIRGPDAFSSLLVVGIVTLVILLCWESYLCLVCHFFL